MGVFAFFLIIVSVFHLLAPRAAWYLHLGWKLQDAEPSEGYLTFLRFGGGIGIVVGIIMMITAISGSHG